MANATRPEFSPEIEAWAQVIRKSKSERKRKQVRQQFTDMGTAAFEPLEILSHYPSTIVRGWVASLAPELLGGEAVPILQMLTRDRDRDTRDTARIELERLSSEYVPALLPGIRADLKKGTDPFGAAGFAMRFLARHRDPQAVPILRAFAAKYPDGHFAHREPLVIADYIENPSSLVDRIRHHDHDWFYWLVEIGWILDVPGIDDVFEEVLRAPFDQECVEIIRDAQLRRARYRARRAG